MYPFIYYTQPSLPNFSIKVKAQGLVPQSLIFINVSPLCPSIQPFSCCLRETETERARHGWEERRREGGRGGLTLAKASKHFNGSQSHTEQYGHSKKTPVSDRNRPPFDSLTYYTLKIVQITPPTSRRTKLRQVRINQWTF